MAPPYPIELKLFKPQYTQFNQLVILHSGRASTKAAPYVY